MAAMFQRRPWGILLLGALQTHGASLRQTRYISGSIPRRKESTDRSQGFLDVEELLGKPTWSVSSLLPPKGHGNEAPAISSKQLHHLLRLSALPPPKDDEDEAEMLKTLASQLHFVKEIQRVDTAGVEPFRSLRDETAKGEMEAEVGLATLKDALDEEDVVGKHHRRIRRTKTRDPGTQQQWDVLGTAERTVGRYFVVEGGKDG